jgi:hypothetical protein
MAWLTPFFGAVQVYAKYHYGYTGYYQRYVVTFNFHDVLSPTLLNWWSLAWVIGIQYALAVVPCTAPCYTGSGGSGIGLALGRSCCYHVTTTGCHTTLTRCATTKKAEWVPACKVAENHNYQEYATYN